MKSFSVPQEIWDFAYLVMSSELKSKFKSSNSMLGQKEEDLPEDPFFFCDKILYIRYMHENIILQNAAHIVTNQSFLIPNKVQRLTHTSTGSAPIFVDVNHAGKIGPTLESPTSVMFFAGDGL